MKKLVLITFSLFFLTSCAQETVRGNGKFTKETRKVSGNFNAVESAGAFDVIIKDGNQDGNIHLEGESNILDKIEVKVQGNTLVLKQKQGFNIRSSESVTITFNARNLEAVGLSGSGTLMAEGVQKSDNFKIGLSGSGDIDVKVETKNLDSAISGSGNINVSGNSESLTVGISGSGDVHAYDLKTHNADIGISGSGNTEVNVAGELKAAVAGSGDIYYKGNPEKINAKSAGSGDVIDAN